MMNRSIHDYYHHPHQIAPPGSIMHPPNLLMSRHHPYRNSISPPLFSCRRSPAAPSNPHLSGSISPVLHDPHHCLPPPAPRGRVESMPYLKSFEQEFLDLKKTSINELRYRAREHSDFVDLHRQIRR